MQQTCTGPPFVRGVLEVIVRRIDLDTEADPGPRSPSADEHASVQSLLIFVILALIKLNYLLPDIVSV